MANLKYQTQLPGFEGFGRLGEQEVYARGGSAEPAWMTATRASHADPLGAGGKPRSMEYKKKKGSLGAANWNDPYAALYALELEGRL